MSAKKVLTLDDLEPWSKAGPESLTDYPIPENIKVRYHFNDKINSKISIWPGGDSTHLAADAIVNAANEMLRPGGGICGAIHRAAGPNLYKECKLELKENGNFIDPGNAVLTKGYNLPAKYVIHTVGPRGKKPKLLKNAYESTIKLIDGDDIRSIGLCCISTGIFGFPIKPATRIAMKTVREWLEKEENLEKTDRIIFVVFLPKDVKIYYEYLHEFFPLTEQPICTDEEEEKDEEEEEEEKSSESGKSDKEDKKEKKTKSDRKSDSTPEKVTKEKDDKKSDIDEKEDKNKKKDEEKPKNDPQKTAKRKRVRIPKVKTSPVEDI